MSEQRVRVQVDDDGVAFVTLSRPEKHNALDWAMFQGILAAADQVRDDERVKAVVLHGEGRSFCSGLDVPSFAPGNEAGVGIEDVLAAEEGRRGNVAQRVATEWVDLPVPVIAALHGVVFGGGIQIALGADIRIAAPDARLCVMEIKWGLIPDMGITRTLPRLVPIDVAKELTWTGRQLSGTEAAELGVVTRVAEDPLAAATELAREIAGKPERAIRHAKTLFNESWTGDAETTLALEERLQREIIGAAFAPAAS
jgi:enoyl-CoA hydratase/carnithine racemase